MKKNNFILIIFVQVFVLTSSFVSQSQDILYPINEILAKTPNDKLPLSICLYDMDVKNDNESIKSTKYLNRYQIITNVGDPNKQKKVITEWLEVSKKDFVKNYHNLEMEIASKILGTKGLPKVSKIPVPPGYINYIGNDKYGQWQTNNKGASVWAFYGKYLFMRLMFNTGKFPVHQDTYKKYLLNYHLKRVYYDGTYNNRRYGTGSSYSRSISRSGYYTSKRSTRSKAAYIRYR